MPDTFGNNIEFLKFLNLAKNDAVLKASLGKKDYSALNTYPGLSEQERAALKLLNWDKVDIKVTDADIASFQPGIVAAHETICEKRLGPGMAERGCWKT